MKLISLYFAGLYNMQLKEYKGVYSNSYGFSTYVWIWGLDHKESWVPKNWCFWTVVLEKTLESPLGCKEIKLVNPKGNQPWIFIGRTDAEAESPILWPPDAKNWLIRKYPNAGKDWRQEEKGMTEDEMVGWHHRLNGHKFDQALGIGDGQRSLTCWVHGVAKTWLSDPTTTNTSLVHTHISVSQMSVLLNWDQIVTWYTLYWFSI